MVCLLGTRGGVGWQMKKVLFIGDTHFPFVHRPSFALLLKIIREWCPDIVVQAGDLSDNAALKRHTDKPKVFTNLKYDIDTSRKLFKQLDDACVSAGVQLKGITLGNHDTYMARYLMEEAKALYDYADILDPIALMGVEELGWHVVDYHKSIEIGKVSVIHDVGMSGPGSLLRAAHAYGGSVVYGHTHAAGVAYTGDMTGERYVSMNIGWLGDPEFATYMPRFAQSRNWTHGVGYGHALDDGLVFCNFAPFIKNKTVIGGQLVSL